MARLRDPPTAAAALEMLEEHILGRQEDLFTYDAAPDLPESDDEWQRDCRVIDRFVQEGGNEAVHQMTNFTLPEFNAIWIQLKDHINNTYNTGRGSKSPIKGKDLLFMPIAVLKNGAKWDMMAFLFGIKAATFEKGFLR